MPGHGTWKTLSECTTPRRLASRGGNLAQLHGWGRYRISNAIPYNRLIINVIDTFSSIPPFWKGGRGLIIPFISK